MCFVTSQGPLTSIHQNLMNSSFTRKECKNSLKTKCLWPRLSICVLKEGLKLHMKLPYQLRQDDIKIQVERWVFTDQMMMATSLMMASFKQSKKSLRAWPCCFILPMTRPKHMEKTTKPRALTPAEELETGTVSSTVSYREEICVRKHWKGSLNLNICFIPLKLTHIHMNCLNVLVFSRGDVCHYHPPVWYAAPCWGWRSA